MHERRHEGYTPNRDEPSEDPPTFVLDVPVLNVEEIDLEVNDLRAHVSLRAELADLVKINVGVDVYLDEVKLQIKGLEAQALLSIRLDKVLSTLDRALEAIDNNPQILSEVVNVDPAVGTASRSASQDAGTEQVASGPLDQTLDEAGRSVQRTGNESGDVVEEVLDEEGDVPAPSISEEESEDEVDATGAARRKAEELGVKLSDVEGTGSGGRILVKDVEKAAR